jgi:prepilin-type N-terminal cleavage/methylation domain-containing protein
VSRPASRHARAAHGGFTIVELYAALALVGIILTCLFATLPAARRFETRVDREQDAVLVLMNVVERLEAAGGWTGPGAARILEEEFGRSGLAERSGLAPACVESDAGAELRIEAGGGRVAARVMLRR